MSDNMTKIKPIDAVSAYMNSPHKYKDRRRKPRSKNLSTEVIDAKFEIIEPSEIDIEFPLPYKKVDILV